jgi:hypothetical protein
MSQKSQADLQWTWRRRLIEISFHVRLITAERLVLTVCYNLTQQQVTAQTASQKGRLNFESIVHLTSNLAPCLRIIVNV